MEKEKYVSLLEQAVASHNNAPANQVIGWKGEEKRALKQGKDDWDNPIPTTLKSSELDALVSKIVSTGVDEPQVAGEGLKEEEELDSSSPLSMLEGSKKEQVKDLDDLMEETSDVDDVILTEKENSILSRLIREMNDLDETGGIVDDDDYLPSEKEINEFASSLEDDDLED